MKRKTKILLVALALAVLVAGCKLAGGPTTTVLDPTPPVVDPWPAATTQYYDAGYVAGTVPGTPSGALDKVLTKSDGQNLYIKVSFSEVGLGQNFYVLIDDVAQTSGYDPSRWDSTFTLWWGNMGMNFEKNNTDFFDPDLIYLRARSWDSTNPGVWVTEDWAEVANKIVGPEEGDSISVKDQTSDVALAADGSEYEITIPYSAIGREGAKSGAKLQIVILLGRDTYGPNEGEFITDRPLGVQSMIPYTNQGVTDEGLDTARISEVNDAVLVTLK